MKELKSPFDHLPSLSQGEALKILSTPINKLELASDYYKAAFHLSKFPGPFTEEALLRLVESESSELAVVIARKKAVEGLARLRCIAAIPAIGRCLTSSDPNLVEISAWALKELDCQDPDLHQVMMSLLDDPKQHRRVLIQSLACLGVVSAAPRIESLQDDATPGVRGAALAAVFRLCGKRDRLLELELHLALPVQVDRHLAIQDVIDAGEFDLLKATLRAPVSPTFRMRALNALWPEEVVKKNGLDLLVVLDGLMRDDPDDLDLVHHYDESPKDAFLIEELFGTDFSRCYLAVQTLRSRNPTELWPLLLKCWERAKKDYGAIYFFMILFRSITEWPEIAQQKIQDFCFSALDRRWPDFIKFKPASILTLMQYSPEIGCAHLSEWLNPEKSPYWACRYAALLAIEPLLHAEGWGTLAEDVVSNKEDPHRFVRAKLNSLKMNCVGPSPLAK